MRHRLRNVSVWAGASLALALVLSLAGSPVMAQERPARFRAEPFVGVYVDQFVGTRFGDPTLLRESKPGLLAGLSLSYGLTNRTRLTGTFGYTEVNGFGKYGDDAANYFSYGKDSWLASAGAEYDVLRGRTGLSLGLQGGVIADIEEHEGVVGSPSEVTKDQYGAYFPSSYGLIHAVAVPTVGLSRRLGSSVTLRLDVRDYVLVDDVEWSHRPAFTLGVSLGR
mgnify:CR=1 FL=1